MSALVLLLSTVMSWAAPPQVVNVGSGFTNVYAVDSGDGVILVDAHNPGNGERILRRLEAAGIDRSRVTAVVLTHAHPDHAGSAAELRDLLDVPVVVGAGDAPMLASGDGGSLRDVTTGLRGSLIVPFVRKEFPGMVADVEVDRVLDLSVYGVYGTARAVGGHTAGSLVIELDGGAVLSGDLIRSHVQRRRHPTLHFFHEDAAAAHGQLADVLTGEVTRLYPAHGGPLDPAEVAAWLDERAPHHEARLAHAR